jgi:hypothetical protein
VNARLLISDPPDHALTGKISLATAGLGVLGMAGVVGGESVYDFEFLFFFVAWGSISSGVGRGSVRSYINNWLSSPVPSVSCSQRMEE